MTTRASATGEGEGEGDAGGRSLARIVLALGTVFGFAYLGYVALVAPGKPATDFEVYRAAAAHVRAGEPLYGTSPVGVSDMTYRYPPVTLLFALLSLAVPASVGYGLHVVGTLAASAALAVLVVRAIERRGVATTRIDRVLVAAFVAVGSHVTASLVFGNVNHHVALATAAGLAWLGDGRHLRAGTALGVAALVKVFPAGLGAWLLWRRAWRAIGAAVATGLGGLAAGLVLFGPARTRAYLTDELLPRSAPAAAAGGVPPESVYVTLRRPLSVALPDAGTTALGLAAVALAAPVVGYCYVRADGPVDRLAAVFATLAGVLIVLPSYSLYWIVLAYPLVVLLYVLEGPVQRLFAAGAGLSTLTLKLPDVGTALDLLPVGAGIERPVLAVARRVYALGTPVLWGTALMLAACVWRVRRSGPTAADPARSVDGRDAGRSATDGGRSTSAAGADAASRAGTGAGTGADERAARECERTRGPGRERTRGPGRERERTRTGEGRR